MHYYTYLSTSKIDMLYDQISNLSGKEVSFSGEGSLLAVKGGVDVKTKITTTTQEKIDVIREELELEGSLGQIGSTRNEEYISYSLPTFFTNNEEFKIAMWFSRDYDYETDTMYKILMHGSTKNLVSRDDESDGSSYGRIYGSIGMGKSDLVSLIRYSILQNQFQDEVQKNPTHQEIHNNRYGLSKKMMDLTDLVDEMFIKEPFSFDRNATYREIPRIYTNCEILAKVLFRKRVVFDGNKSNSDLRRLENDLFRIPYEKCKYIEYIIGSPLYVDTGQVISQ